MVGNWQNLVPLRRITQTGTYSAGVSGRPLGRSAHISGKKGGEMEKGERDGNAQRKKDFAYLSLFRERVRALGTRERNYTVPLSGETARNSMGNYPKDQANDQNAMKRKKAGNKLRRSDSIPHLVPSANE